jgi:hypothetical protein
MTRWTPSLVAIVAERMLQCKAMQAEMVQRLQGSNRKVNSRAAMLPAQKESIRP